MPAIALFFGIIIDAVAVLLKIYDYPTMLAVPIFILGIVIICGLRKADNWERAIVLRFGKYCGTRGPGLFFVIPMVDKIASVIDTRLQATVVATEKALSKDTVPVDLDAVIFWHVFDSEKAALEITNFKSAVIGVAQTTLREMIGSSDLTKLMSDRKVLDAKLKEDLNEKTKGWGIDIQNVEIRDVGIPAGLFDAMSRQAQAERERDARVILAGAELTIAESTARAAEVYDRTPTALKLRQMGLVYEMGKNGSTVIIPSEMANSMGNTAASVAALTNAS